ncbi:hypothetical protein GGH19_004099 [Coemansia sp. RSA 1807]|nr:hypothetical protein LPJ58_003021 [Coemansia sp. RSA 1591]KAJ1761719.1 hypothetical protein LPJ69_002979 [Coemansia sp. RSA 1752]KAJ2141033.1 hypothetical protein IW142_005079 [Coemansia sp. RSA 564]KAJ2215141.1 hypothetical protein IW143_003622 [Coemansia sp. RSA 520]KAJ2287815.1 hypothetical protein IW141_004688 [Coemansia sp. RSA 355]KAJ2437391.1 hypothetical protein IWW46_005349 [Coemansia sp. RSA 2440]KAJ2550621.1 hypothetical protein IWW35_003204 [Coemansia sp. RSA 1878]KAJ2574069.1
MRWMSSNPSSYEEKAKQQLRDYQAWRKHFTWSPELVRNTIRDYTLWTILGLIAYYNMTKTHELEEYEARTYVIIDKLEEQIKALDPSRQLLDTEQTSQSGQPSAHTDDDDEKPPNMFF